MKLKITEYRWNVMLIVRVGLKSSVVVLHIQSAPGAPRAPSLAAGSCCDKRKDPAHTSGSSRGRKCKAGTRTGTRETTPSPVAEGGHFQQKAPGKKQAMQMEKKIIIICYKCPLKYLFGDLSHAVV